MTSSSSALNSNSDVSTSDTKSGAKIDGMKKMHQNGNSITTANAVKNASEIVSQASSVGNLRVLYENWVRNNSALIGAAEESVRTVLLLLPGRFAESELGSETLYTIMNLLSMYHRKILGEPHLSSALLVCNAEETSAIRNIRNMLAVIQHLEVVLEMLASRLAVFDSKWRIVLAIESIKAWCRILLLFHNRGQMLICATKQECTQASLMLEHAVNERVISPLHSNTLRDTFDDVYCMYRAHGRDANGVHPHGKFGVSTLYGERAATISIASSQQIVAELLHISRPVVFVTLTLLCKKSSWTPFMAALSTDLTSRLLLGRMSSLTTREKQEVRRRMFLWSFYLLRSPFFEKFTSLPISRLLKLFGRIPLFGVFFENMLDLCIDLQSHYFYTSASS